MSIQGMIYLPCCNVIQELVTKFLTGEIFDVKGNKDESDNEVLAVSSHVTR